MRFRKLLFLSLSFALAACSSDSANEQGAASSTQPNSEFEVVKSKEIEEVKTIVGGYEPIISPSLTPIRDKKTPVQTLPEVAPQDYVSEASDMEEVRARDVNPEPKAPVATKYVNKAPQPKMPVNANPARNSSQKAAKVSVNGPRKNSIAPKMPINSAPAKKNPTPVEAEFEAQFTQPSAPAKQAEKAPAPAPAQEPERIVDEPKTQEPAPTPKIVETKPIVVNLKFENDDMQPLPTVDFLKYISHQPGGTLEVSKLGDDAAAIKKEFPEFVSITTRVDPIKDKKGKVNVTFEFLRKRIIRSVQIVIPKSVENPPMDLREKLLTSAGKNLRASEIARDAEGLRIVFVQLGYPKASIQHEVKLLDKEQGTVSVAFHVKLGSAKAHLSGIAFKGVNNFTKDKLKTVMQRTKTSWSSLFGDGPVFDLIALEEDVNTLTEFYQSEGFPDAAVKYTYQVDEKGKTKIIITVHEGKRHWISKIEFRGNKLFDSATLLAALPIEPNSPYTSKAHRTAPQKIREMYGEKGFAASQVEANYDSERQTLVFNIFEGEIQYIERVEIKGNERSKDTMVLNFIKFTEGDIVNTRSITDSANAMYKTGYYSKVDIKFQPNQTRPGYGSVVVNLVENDSKSLDFGVAYGTASGLGGDANIGFSNIKGNGVDFSIHAYKNDEMKKLMLMFRDNHILDSNFNLTASAGYSELIHRDEYQKNVISARVMLERQVARNLTLGIGTRLEFVSIDEVDPSMPAEVHDAAAGDGQIVAGLVSTMVFEKEKVDENGDAYGGQKIRMTFMPSYSEEAMYLKAAATAIQHVKLGETKDGRKHVLTGRITLAYVGDDTPFHEKLYAGGNSTLRGYKTYSVKPDGSKLGGTTLASGGTYYSFPISGDMFRGVAFMEAASVGNGFSELSDIRAVGGVGVRANLNQTFLRTKVEAGVVMPVITKSGDSVNPFYLLFGNYHPMYDL